MLVSEFDFDLPLDLIAQYPASERDLSRLMVLDRRNKTISDDSFRGIASHLLPGDLLVMNDTRVIPARIFGKKETGGKVEIFLLRRKNCASECWNCMIKASKGLKIGSSIFLDETMTAKILERVDAETWLVEFEGKESFSIWLDQQGHVPLPPYLQRKDIKQDRERYQTVYASTPGAVAAPTAGLHFTDGLLAELAALGIKTAFLTLHTGLGTFKPVRVDRVEDHRIHTENYCLPTVTAEQVRAAKEEGRRVVAVGTTVARTLEFAAENDGTVRAGDGEANIFIYPGYKFKVVDALITNFHLPKSTLLMLLSAFAGKKFTDEAYSYAISRGYRFYSYGDAMFIH